MSGLKLKETVTVSRIVFALVGVISVAATAESGQAAADDDGEEMRLTQIKTPEWKGETHDNSIGIVLRRINTQSFQMGSIHAPPVHEVELSEYWIGAHEVTNAQYELFDPEHKQKRPERSNLDNSPATAIGWCGAVGFCYWLSKREGIEYRLPTEAEWECASRGGLKGKLFPWGDDDPQGRANLLSDAAQPVGSYAPNRFGLFDMVGNAFEFCWDVSDDDYYSLSPRKDPRGPNRTLSDEFRIIRGGSYRIGAIGDMNARRIPRGAWRFKIIDDGFRVVVGSKPWNLYSDPPDAKCDNATRLKYPCFHPVEKTTRGEVQ